MDSNVQIKLLNNVKGPEDIKMMDEDLLPELCSEIRSVLISTVSKNGGHLASNLGTVELTVALHRCFNSPADKIIWDVGHQAYTHKIITGRYEKFNTLRKENGISGFTRPDESEHDTFYEGHAGTSVSQASGIAAANSIKGSKNYAVAVLGDGSLCNGMVYEALNQAGSTKNRLIVILNDNEMSISENVGAMAKYLAIVRAKPEYYRLKANTEKTLKKIPVVGKGLSNHLFKLKTAIKNIIYSSSFFEDLGFRYLGPIDGHDIVRLSEAMDSAKMSGGPVLLHVNTVKGKGYDFAEHSPELFHGISEFDIDTGESNSSGENYSTHFGRTLCDFAKKDKRICAITAAMALGTGLEQFSKDYPERFFDVGIAEEHATTFASGLAKAGMIPVFAVYSTFAQRCIDQLIHDGALQRQKMIIAVDRAGFVGEDGETHQGLFDVSLTRSLPNTTIYSPSTYSEMDKALYNALYKDENLVIIRYPRGRAEKEIDSDYLSNDFCVFGDIDAPVSLVTYGRLFFNGLHACNSLDSRVKLIKINRIKPLSDECLRIISSSSNVFFFEEAMTDGGVGQLVGSELCSLGYKGTFKHIAVNDEFVSHADTKSLMKKYHLDSDSMVDIIGEVLKNE